MTLRIVEHVSLTDVGRQRSSNEDALLEAMPMFAVADGMGGARAGEVASGIAVEMLAEEAEEGSPEERLERAAQAANSKIFELAQQDESRSGMGTTLTAVILAEGQVAAAHVGDSRLYRFRDGELDRLTRDHSLVEELVRRGELDPDAVESHPQRAIITRALGPAPAVEVDTFSAAARPDDVYLLCSDGLTTMVKEDHIAEIVRSRSSLEDAANRLVNTANENGGLDNVTVVLFAVAEREEESLEEDEYATRADLRVEDVEHALAAESSPPARPEPAVPQARTGVPSPPRRRLRAALTAFFVLLSIGVLLAGFWFGTRQVYFLGSGGAGKVTLFNGVPLDLPGEVRLYEPVRTTGVPASSLPPRQRAVALDRRLRSRGDALDLVATLERQRREALAAAARERRARESGGGSRPGGQSSGEQRPGGSQSSSAGGGRKPAGARGSN